MKEYLQQYHDYMLGTRNMRASSAATYIKRLEQIETQTNKPLPDMSALDYQTYFIRLKTDKKKVNYQKLIQVAVKNFWEWYSITHEIANPVQGLKIIRREYISPDILNQDEVLLMIDACDLNKGNAQARIIALRNAAMICLLADTGIRVGELVRLNVEHCIMEKDKFILKVAGGPDGTKGYRQRSLPFADLKPGEVIGEYWSMYWTYIMHQEYRRQNEPLFMRTCRGGYLPGRMSIANVQHTITKIAKKIGTTKKISPHSFRHFYATYFIANDGRIEVLKDRLGHASLDATMRYVHLADMVKSDNLLKNPMAGKKPLNMNVNNFVRALKGSHSAKATRD